MNTKLLKKHIDVSLDAIVVVPLKEDGSNAKDFFVADVVGNKKFAQNFGGYPRSEIAEINECTNIEVQKNLLNALTDYRAGADGQNVGLSDIQIAMGHRSKYQQTPCEMQDWIESQLQKSYEARVAKLNSLRAQSEAGDKIKFNANDKPNEQS